MTRFFPAERDAVQLNAAHVTKLTSYRLGSSKEFKFVATMTDGEEVEISERTYEKLSYSGDTSIVPGSGRALLVFYEGAETIEDLEIREVDIVAWCIDCDDTLPPEPITTAGRFSHMNGCLAVVIQPDGELDAPLDETFKCKADLLAEAIKRAKKAA